MATILTNAGLAVITLAITQATTPPKFFGWGTGAAPGGTFTASSTGLVTEKDVDLAAAGPARTSATLSQTTTVSPTNNTFQAQATRTATGAGTVTNVGLFDAASAGNSVVLVDGQSVLLAIGDSIQGTFQIKFA